MIQDLLGITSLTWWDNILHTKVVVCHTLRRGVFVIYKGCTMVQWLAIITGGLLVGIPACINVAHPRACVFLWEFFNVLVY